MDKTRTVHMVNKGGLYMGKYFTEQERYKLEGLLQAKTSVKEIAEILGKCERAVYYEIKRGKVTLRNSDYTERTVYQADVAQRKYEENRTYKGASLKIGNDMDFVRHVEDMIINHRYSPYAILQDIKANNLEFKTSVCTTTLYSYIHKGIFLNVKSSHLPQMKDEKKQEYKRTVALHNRKGKSIEQRPKEIEKRNTVGHWEMYTVVSGSNKGTTCLLVLTERATRKEQMFKIPNKQGETVKKVLDRLERELGSKRFRNTYKTITCDNGVEFLDYKSLEKSVRNTKTPRTTIYYCHPYTSSERGTNENQNKLIRRFIPKGANIADYTDEQIKYIENWINNYPRKIFKGKSSLQTLTELQQNTA